MLEFEPEPRVWAILLALGIVSLVGLIAWRNRPKRGSVTLAVAMFIIAISELSYLLSVLTPHQILFYRFRWLGLGPIMFAWFAFTLAFTGRGNLLTRKTIIVLAAWPLALNLFLWVPPASALIGYDVFSAEAMAFLREESSLYDAHLAVSYALGAVSTALIIVHMYESNSLFEQQGTIILVGISFGWTGSLLTEFSAINFSTFQLGLALMGLTFLWGVLRAGLTELTPVARKTVVETITAGVLVINTEGRIMDYNDVAVQLLGLEDKGEIIERNAAKVLAEHPSVLNARTQEDGNRATELLIEGRTIQVTTAPLVEDNKELGRTILLYDVTEQKERAEALKRKTERLEKLTAVISHDLRSPLDVAGTRLRLLDNRLDTIHNSTVDDREVQEHLSTALGSIERANDITEELLELSDNDCDINSDRVVLRSVATEAWETVKTRDLELEILGSVTLQAERGSMKRLFENCFRNVVEHTEGATTVTVGAFPGGFYIEDNGCGIDEEHRENVLNRGYSTRTDGSGLGLAIVAQVANDHGWDVDVLEGQQGGTRIEIRTDY